jgi:hypothetical protein
MQHMTGYLGLKLVIQCKVPDKWLKRGTAKRTNEKSVLSQKFTLTVCEACKYNYILRNDTIFMSILLTELFDKVFEVWLLQVHEPEYFTNNIIICF